MSRIAECFSLLAQQNKKALVPYIVAGDPHKNLTLEFMHGMVAHGASIIELGLPFSDPMADGPSNQAGHERALKNRMSTQDVLALVASFRKTNQTTPVVLMGYLNPVEVYGYARFAQAAKDAGVDGVLIVDLPPEEAKVFKTELNQRDMDLIFLIAPTTSAKRMKLICEQASGFLYYVSLKGVTGAGHLDVEEVKQKIAQIREFTTLPINVGFGIKDGASARKLAEAADGVVVGSVLVEQCAMANQQNIAAALNGMIHDIRHALDT